MGPTAAQLDRGGVRDAGAEAPATLTGIESTPAGQRRLIALVARRTATGGGPTLTAPSRNVRSVEAIDDLGGPSEPIRYGDTPARPARQPVATSLNLAGIKAVMRDEFWINLVRRPPIAARPRGRQHPWLERVNVHRPLADPYGSQLVLDPQGSAGFTASPVYAGMP